MNTIATNKNNKQKQGYDDGGNMLTRREYTGMNTIATNKNNKQKQQQPGYNDDDGNMYVP